MFPQMLMSAFTPLRDRNEFEGWENKPFITSWPEPQENHVSSSKDHLGSYHDDGFFTNGSTMVPTENNYYRCSYPQHGMKILRFPEEKCGGDPVTKTIKKKKKRIRTAFTTDQLNHLEQYFEHTKYIDAPARRSLAKTIKLTDRTVKIWFQNRRMKKKKESLDVYDSDSSEKSTLLVGSPNDVSNDSPTEYVPQLATQHVPQHVSQQVNHVDNSGQHSVENYNYAQGYSVNYPNNIDINYSKNSLPNNAFSEIHYDYQSEYLMSDLVNNQPIENVYNYNNDEYSYLSLGAFL